jgi:predicted transcriptional regulator
MMVVEQDRKYAVLEAMANEYTRKILVSTISAAKPVEEIAKENGIPLSTCYRRIRELISMHLLRIERTIITESGKKFETYRSTVKDATVNFSGSEISIEVTLVPREPEEKLAHLWKSVQKEATGFQMIA